MLRHLPFDAPDDESGEQVAPTVFGRDRDLGADLGGELPEDLEAAFGAEEDEPAGAGAVAWTGRTSGGDDDAEIARYVARANASAGNEALSALSALSHQMSSYRPLTPPEQQAALDAYRNGLLARAELAGRVAGRRRPALESTARRGERAHAELVGSMFRLVLLIARENAADRYGRERALDMLADLVAEANLALVEAVDSYDEAKCPTFAIYAGRVVRDRVRMCLSKSGPVGLAPSWLRLKRIATVLAPEVAAKLGRTPTTAEMQAELRIVCMKWARDRLTDVQRQLPEPQQLGLMESKLRKQGMLGAIEKFEEVMVATQQVASLDSPVGDDGGARLGDLIPGRADAATFEPVELDELRRDLMAALEAMPPRDREIVLYRFGFIDGEQWTYAKLAPRYSVSAERIRQIERNVLTKLRGPGFGGLSAHLPSGGDDGEE